MIHPDFIPRENEIKVEKVELKKIRIAYEQHFSKMLLDSEIDIIEQYAGQIALRVEGYIWGEGIETKFIKYPKDWKEAFKARWFPSWLLRRYPIKYATHEISIKALYPNLRVSVPREQHSLIIEEYRPQYPFSNGVK